MAPILPFQSLTASWTLELKLVPSLSVLVLPSMIVTGTTPTEVAPAGHLMGSPVPSFRMKVKPHAPAARTPASARTRIRRQELVLFFKGEKLVLPLLDAIAERLGRQRLLLRAVDNGGRGGGVEFLFAVERLAVGVQDLRAAGANVPPDREIAVHQADEREVDLAVAADEEDRLLPDGKLGRALDRQFLLADAAAHEVEHERRRRGARDGFEHVEGDRGADIALAGIRGVVAPGGIHGLHLHADHIVGGADQAVERGLDHRGAAQEGGGGEQQAEHRQAKEGAT